MQAAPAVRRVLIDGKQRGDGGRISDDGRSHRIELR